jgi:hypothetical protein
MNVGKAFSWLGIIGLGLASGCAPVVPTAEALYERQVDGEVFDMTPVRGDFKPLLHRRGSFEYRCSECHNDFTSPQRQNPEIPEHAAIVEKFDHGMNTSCVNCHHPEDRNSYVDHEGAPISSTEPAKLCSKCHGPTYREWEVGIHGRQNGSWDRNNPARTKLLCIQCHDPHSPKFAPMIPDPPAPRSRFDTADPHPNETAGAADHAGS